MSDELVYSSAAQHAAQVAAGKISSRELTTAYLDRIEALDGNIGSFLCVDRENALATADAVDKKVKNGDALGLLAGVPIALKDVLVTKGLKTTAASKILANWTPPYDGTVVKKIRDAGGVILGKLNLDEFAMGSSNENSAFKLCANPWNYECVPGGSSGGSAASVAAGLCAASLGTDTGGSIRQPAALCGVVGIKPTYGRVSRYGVIAFASSLDQIGPLTRNVEDAALLLEVICGFDAKDSTSAEIPVPRFRDALEKDIKNLKIGVPKEFRGDGVHAEVTANHQAALKTLEELGAEIIEISLPHTQYALPTYYLLAPAEASSNLARFDGIRYGHRTDKSDANLMEVYCDSRGAGFGAEVKRRIMLGTFALRSGYYDAYYLKAQRVRALIKKDFDDAFAKVDVIASPTSPFPAFKIGAKSSDPIEMYKADIFTLSCNLAGLPGMSVPAGFTKDGLPTGLQLLGKALDESTILQVAANYERATEHHQKRPQVKTGGPQS